MKILGYYFNFFTILQVTTEQLLTIYHSEVTLNSFIRDFFFFFTISLFLLINGEAVLFYHNRPHCSIE